MRIIAAGWRSMMYYVRRKEPLLKRPFYRDRLHEHIR